jgi:hypothetical protein
MWAHWSLDVAIAPEAALARITGAINRPKKRAFGIFKLQNEYVGVVGVGEFEIWERQQRAIHALGSIRARRGGSRLDVRFGIGRRTPVLIAVFFVLYATVALGIATLPPGPDATAAELAVAAVGAAILATMFAAAAARQRSELTAFIERLFADVPRA